MAEASADFDKLLKKSENVDPNIARFSPRGMSTMDNLRTSKSMTNGKEPREGTARLWGAGPPARGSRGGAVLPRALLQGHAGRTAAPLLADPV